MTSKARFGLVVFSILLIGVILSLVRTRHPKMVASIAIPPSKPAASHPKNTQDALIPARGQNSTGTVEICGHGQVAIDKTDDGALFRYVGKVTQSAGARWLTALQDSSDLRARVAGLLLEGKVTGDGSLRPVAEQTRNEVVQLAAGAGDPAVYSMALSMCGAATDGDVDSACRRLSLLQWARIDSDNAAPWLLLAGKARTRHDSAAEADAFSHAAAAHRIDSYNYSLLAFGEPELSPNVTPLERSYLATEVIGVGAAIGLPEYSIASHHCSLDAMQDSATVRQQCDSLAELLVTKGANLLDLGIGKTIGERAGWPSERVKKLVLEQHALMQAIIQQTPSDNDKLWTCDALSRVERLRDPAGATGRTRGRTGRA